MILKIACLALFLGACGGAAAPTEPPKAASEPPKTAPRASKISEESAKPPAAESESPPPSAPAVEPPPEPAAKSAPTKRPSEILGAPTVAFIVDYQASTPSESAEKNCDTEAKDDVSARAECMQKARGEFLADVLSFKKDSHGHWWLTVYERRGSDLPEVYKAQVDFADEKTDSITLRLKDAGNQGKRPFFAGAKQIVVAFPDDYSIRLNDPKLGRLVYNAKVGLVGK